MELVSLHLSPSYRRSQKKANTKNALYFSQIAQFNGTIRSNIASVQLAFSDQPHA